MADTLYNTNLYSDTLLGNPWSNYGHDNHFAYYFNNGGYRSWTGAEKAAFGNALQSWADVADVTFSQVNSSASADFVETLSSTDNLGWLYGFGTVAVHQLPSYYGQASGYFSADGATSNNIYALGAAPALAGSAVFETFVHELGHALGLRHPHDGGFPGVDGPFDKGDGGLNTNVFTVMSYNEFGSRGASYGHVATPMAFDIAAIQYLYGANVTYHAGDDVYVLNTASWSCLWDAGGLDAMVYNGTAGVTLDLREATLKSGPGAGGFLSALRLPADKQEGGFTIAKGAVIENATGGSGNDRLNGNGVANLLQGNGGDDILTGYGGDDTLVGGAGDDVYYIDAGDIVSEKLKEGRDTVCSASSIQLSDFTSIECAVLLGNQSGLSIKGHGGANKLTGNSQANTLWGLGGNDELVGGLGRDSLYGGMGDDTYVLGADTDLVSEADGGGIDTIVTTISRTLKSFSGIENARLTGGTWNTQTSLTGNDANNLLEGDRGTNVLDGGRGQDTMKGGYGADVYIVDSVGDLIIEVKSDLDPDTVRTANFSIDLAYYRYVEEAALSGARNLSLKGTDAAEYLTGNAGKNVLTGGGGADVLRGGAAADVFKYLKLTDSSGPAIDTIADFGAIDIIDLQAIDADAMTAGNQAFKFVGASAFSGVAGELHVVRGPYYFVIEADVNGDKKADLTIGTSSSYHSFNAGDFVL